MSSASSCVPHDYLLTWLVTLRFSHLSRKGGRVLEELGLTKFNLSPRRLGFLLCPLAAESHWIPLGPGHQRPLSTELMKQGEKSRANILDSRQQIRGCWSINSWICIDIHCHES